MPSDEPTDPLPEQPRGDLHFDFVAETEFFDQLAALVPAAALRIPFYERAIRHYLDRSLKRLSEGRPPGRLVHLLGDGEGMMITEPSETGIPECLVYFTYREPIELGSTVVLWRVRPAPPLDDAEDYSGDP